MRQRNVQHEGFQDFLLPVAFGEHGKTSHHLQTVGKLKDRHARIPRVLDDELFVILCLQPRILGLDGRNLIEAVYQVADDIAPLPCLYLITAHAAGLVQVNGGNAFFRKTNLFLDDTGHRVRVADKRRTVVAGLVPQDRHRHFPRLCDDVRGAVHLFYYLVR